MTEDTVTVAQAADLLGVTSDEVERLAREAKFGGWWFQGQPLSRRAVEAYRDQGQPKPPAPRRSTLLRNLGADPQPAPAPARRPPPAPAPRPTTPPPPPAPVVVPPAPAPAAPLPPSRAHAHAHAHEAAPAEQPGPRDGRRGGRRGGGGVENVTPGRLVEARARALVASRRRTLNQEQALRAGIAVRRAAGDSDERIVSGLMSGGMSAGEAARWVERPATE